MDKHTSYHRHYLDELRAQEVSRRLKKIILALVAVPLIGFGIKEATPYSVAQTPNEIDSVSFVSGDQFDIPEQGIVYLAFDPDLLDGVTDWQAYFAQQEKENGASNLADSNNLDISKESVALQE